MLGSKGQQLDGNDINNNFGYNLSLSSNGLILAVGAYRYDSNKGQVKVYEWDGTNWIQKGQPLDGDVNGSYFGSCVSLSSNGLILAVGDGVIIRILVMLKFMNGIVHYGHKKVVLL